MFKTLRSRIALLLIAANLPVVAVSIAIGRHEFAIADLYDRDRLVQAAELLAARAAGVRADDVPLASFARDSIFRDRGSRSEIAAAIVGPEGGARARDEESAPYGQSWLPENGMPRSELAEDPRIRKDRGADGRPYRYAIASIRNSDAKAIVAAPFDLLGRSQTQWLFLALGLPALMVLSCIGLVMFGIERFVLRWIRALRSAALGYDGGRIDTQAVRMDGAPRELAELGDALGAMATRVDERSAALEAAVEARDRLLRELHHRVKNNFQMIASLLALQRQEAPETLSPILRAPEDRVRAMAAAYKVSYASGEIGHVGVAELIRDVAQQARQFDGSRSFSVEAHFPEEAFEIDLDLAVSLALLLTELLSAAATAADKAMVTAEAGPSGTLALTIAGPAEGWLPSAGLSHRLIRAYAEQLSTGIEDRGGGAIQLFVRLASEKPSIGMKH